MKNSLASGYMYPSLDMIVGGVRRQINRSGSKKCTMLYLLRSESSQGVTKDVLKE